MRRLLLLATGVLLSIAAHPDVVGQGKNQGEPGCPKRVVQMRAVDGGTNCGCYFTADCVYCGGYGECTKSGKLDGSCKQEPKPRPGMIDLRLGPQPLAQAVNLYLSAYAQPIKKGQGRGDNTTFDKAQNVNLGRESREKHEALQEILHEALDATLGFDFDFRQFQCSPGNIRGVPNGAEALLEAVRTGLVAAVEKRDPEAVVAPLHAFWKAYPKYRPLHTGRYYPHGHPGINPDPERSQIDVLTISAERIVGRREMKK